MANGELCLAYKTRRDTVRELLTHSDNDPVQQSAICV